MPHLPTPEAPPAKERSFFVVPCCTYNLDQFLARAKGCRFAMEGALHRFDTIEEILQKRRELRILKMSRKASIIKDTKPGLQMVPIKPLTQRISKTYYLRYVIIFMLLLAVTIVVLVGINVAYSLKQVTKGQNTSLTSAHVETLSVQRTASYAGLSITVVDAQEAPSFPDDTIGVGQMIVRLNLRIANTTPHPVSVVYYSIACLIVQKMGTLTPTNMHLATETRAGKSQDGWLDFSLPRAVPLNTLILQLGSVSLNEALVNIPFAGRFNSSQYTDHVVAESLTISYNYYDHILLYHLKGVEVRFAFHGTQCNAGQRFYVIDFSVDNPGGVDVSPGYGFDYVRLVLNGNDRPPIENTLPPTFKANVKSVKGYVVFAAPSGLKTFTLGFLSQNGNPEQDTAVAL